MTPIEKNIIVVDEHGNEYEATYPKRARGLVKNGRARFIDENKIMLACPPDDIIKTEDIKMSENTEKKVLTEETANETENTTAKATENDSGVTVKMIFDAMNDLKNQLAEIKNSPAQIGNQIVDALDSIGDSGCEGDVDQIISEIGRPFALREDTYLTMLSMYEKMLDSLCPKSSEILSASLKSICAIATAALDNRDTESVYAALDEITSLVTHLTK